MLWLRIDKTSSVPMIRQLYMCIRERILENKLPPNSKLSSSRDLAQQLEISRNVVLEAYDLLIAEGFLETRPGAGTFVADGASYKREVHIEQPVVEDINMGYEAERGIINFRAGTPDLSLFPVNIWLKMLKEVFLSPPQDMLAYGHPEGRQELRKAICDYVVNQREVACHPDQIVITAGTTQAIGIVSQLLLGKKKDVVLEDPITQDIKLIAKSNGARLHSVYVDNEGIQTSNLPQNITPSFVYVTPSHQFPIGGTLPIQRRIELLNYAESNKCYVVEDDYDSEFRFDGPPLSSLHGLCPERVVYIGTFSKTLCPAIRIGYLVLPAELINLGRSRKWQSDLHNEISSQLTLAKFIEQGYYLKHVNKMRKHYMRRRKTLLQELYASFKDQVEILGSPAGLHLAAKFEGYAFSDEKLKEIENCGARFYPLAAHSNEPEKYLDTLLIGYGNLSELDIKTGIDILKQQVP